MGFPSLRPWDLSVDPLNRPPLRPFERAEEMVERTQGIFDKIDSKLAEDFQLMRQLRLLDLDNRKGKAPGGYQSTLSESRLPFIFMNAVGIHRDVETMLHEAATPFMPWRRVGRNCTPTAARRLNFAKWPPWAWNCWATNLSRRFIRPEARRARRDHLRGS